MYKNLTKNKNVTHKQTTTTELQAPDLCQAHTYIQNAAGLNMLAGSQPSPNQGQWCYSTT